MTKPSRSPLSVRLVDFFLAVALFGIPVLLGGRTGWGQLALVVTAAGAAISWSLGRVRGSLPGYRWNRTEPILIAGVGLLVLQVISLPPKLVQSLSPQIAEWLPLWTETELGQWTTLTLAPGATISAAISLGAMAVLFTVACQRIRTVDDVERTLKAVAIAAGLMAVFGLVQYIIGNGKFFWFYDHPFTTTAHRVKGTFTNKNHFVQFLALGTAPMAWWLLKIVGTRSGSADGPDRSRRFVSMMQRVGAGDLKPGLLMVGLGLVIFAGLLSLSRGGALALGTASLVCLVLFCRHRQVSGRPLTGLAAAGIVVGGGLSIYGFQNVSERLEDWNPGARLMIWDANLKIVEDFTWTGTGLGTHAEAYRHYLSEPFQLREFTHAENSPLQVASEAGLIGLLLCVAIVTFCLAGCRTSLRRGVDTRVAVASAAVTASLLAHLVHCFFDFIWYVPGCMIVVVMLAACARSLAANASANGDSIPQSPSPVGWAGRLGWVMVTASVVLASGFGLQRTQQRIAGEEHWNEYLRLRFPKQESPLEGDSLTAAGQKAKQRQVHRQRMLALGRTITADPNHARAHLRLAAHYITRVEDQRLSGRNPHMPLAQIRQAAVTSSFESAAERDEWLSRPGVLGHNRRLLDKALAHARHALSLCPLQGMGYVYLAQLGYLDGDDSTASGHLLDQALTVRPFEARIHEAVGIEAWLAGNLEMGLDHWKQAFGLDRSVQRRILKRLAASGLPAKVIIDEFQPDWESLVFMKDLYQQAVPENEYKVVLAGYAAAARGRADNQNGTDAVTSWLQAAKAYRNLDQSNQAQACYENALEENPASLAARLAFGHWLHSQNRFTEALEHLVWAARQQPDDEKLQRLVKQCRRSAASDGTTRTR